MGLAILWVGVDLPDAQAQVVREDGAGSVAGLLAEGWVDYTFSSRGGEILFADLDAEVYQTQGRTHEEEDGEGDGCAEGGPSRLCLQVIGPDDTVICWAERPNRPGWQRDPRLACPLPQTSGAPASYVLRVAFAPHEGGCGPEAALPTSTEAALPYLLNVSLRQVAPAGSLTRALGTSVNRL